MRRQSKQVCPTYPGSETIVSEKRSLVAHRNLPRTPLHAPHVASKSWVVATPLILPHLIPLPMEIQRVSYDASKFYRLHNKF